MPSPSNLVGPSLPPRQAFPVPGGAAATPGSVATRQAAANGPQPSGGAATGDRLALSAVPRPTTGPSLRDEVALAEQITGKPSHFQTEPELQAYLTSLEKALPQDAYDRQSFLAGLGLKDVKAAGRTDRPVLDAVRAQPGYVPNDDNTGHTPWIQQRFFNLAMSHPSFFLGLTKVTNPLMEAKSKAGKPWTKPFASKQTPHPTGVSVQDRYKDALAKLQVHTATFGPDVHGGIPNVDGPAHPTYGTYEIAMAMGFSDAAARRFGNADKGIDDGTTPYGKTGPMPTDEMDRHFNLDPDGQDTRLVWAKNHLDAAIALAKQQSYDEAEVELGCGLHSLQDLFAHGQISPSLHAVLGQFPDDVDWNPVAFYEATGATQAYLQAYLKAISS